MMIIETSGKYAVSDYPNSMVHFLYPQGWVVYTPYYYSTREEAERAITVQSTADRIMEDIHGRAN
jgi:hypothetical protein